MSIPRSRTFAALLTAAAVTAPMTTPATAGAAARPRLHAHSLVSLPPVLPTVDGLTGSALAAVLNSVNSVDVDGILASVNTGQLVSSVTGLTSSTLATVLSTVNGIQLQALLNSVTSLTTGTLSGVLSDLSRTTDSTLGLVDQLGSGTLATRTETVRHAVTQILAERGVHLSV